MLRDFLVLDPPARACKSNMPRADGDSAAFLLPRPRSVACADTRLKDSLRRGTVPQASRDNEHVAIPITPAMPESGGQLNFLGFLS